MLASFSRCKRDLNPIPYLKRGKLYYIPFKLIENHNRSTSLVSFFFFLICILWTILFIYLRILSIFNTHTERGDKVFLKNLQ